MLRKGSFSRSKRPLNRARAETANRTKLSRVVQVVKMQDSALWQNVSWNPSLRIPKETERPKSIAYKDLLTGSVSHQLRIAEDPANEWYALARLARAYIFSATAMMATLPWLRSQPSV
jgi:hypothetical protein